MQLTIMIIRWGVNCKRMQCRLETQPVDSGIPLVVGNAVVIFYEYPLEYLDPRMLVHASRLRCTNNCSPWWVGK